MDDRKLIQQAIAAYTARGWEIVSQSESSVQLRKPKKWSMPLLVLGVVLLLLFGAGLIFLLLAVVDYAIKKERMIFITADDLRAGKYTKPPNEMAGLLIGAGIIILLFLVCVAIVLLPNL